MDPSNIISFKCGTLHLKLTEVFNPPTMQIHCSMARIDRDGLHVVKGDSTTNVTPEQMVLSVMELRLIVEGYNKVNYYWNDAPLRHDHVLLSCGCTVDWSEYSQEYGSIKLDEKGYAWCPDHEDVTIYRYNKEDFTDENACI